MHAYIDNSDYVPYTASKQPSIEPFGYTKPRQCFFVNIVDDSITEFDESLSLTLSLPLGQAATHINIEIDQSVATLTIADNDCKFFDSAPGSTHSPPTRNWCGKAVPGI